MITYQWIINELLTAPSEDGLTDVVKKISCSRTAQQDEILVFYYGSMSCETPSGTDFTAYADLTYEQVCGWLDAGLNVEEIDLGLDKQIEDIINPPIVILPLPFSNPTI
jgi:hypothetical protein